MHSTMSCSQQPVVSSRKLSSCNSQAVLLARPCRPIGFRRATAPTTKAFLRGYCSGPFSNSRVNQEILEQMFQAAGQPTSTSAVRDLEVPLAVDASEEGDSYVFVADIPGCRREDLKVQTKDHKLSISSKRERSSQPKEGIKSRYERVFGKFARQLRLPEDADCNSIKAKVDNGVLTVTIKKLTKLPGVEDVQVDF